MKNLTKETWDYLKLQPYYKEDVKKLLEFIPTMVEYEVVEFWYWYSQSKCMTWGEIPDSKDKVLSILDSYTIYQAF